MINDIGGSWQRASPYILGFMAAASFLTILDIQPSLVVDGARWVITVVQEHPIRLFFGMILTWAAVSHFYYRKTPITVLENHIDIHYETPDGRRVRIDRKQRIRANRPGVNGYFLTLTVDKGKIPKGSIRADIEHLSPSQSRIRANGDEKRWDVWHIFDEPIPRTPFKIRNRHVVERTMSYLCLDAFTDSEEWYRINLQEGRYPHARLTLSLHFHPGRPPKSCTASKIVAHGVLPMPVQLTPGGAQTGDRYTLSVRRAAKKDFEVRWTF